MNGEMETSGVPQPGIDEDEVVSWKPGALPGMITGFVRWVGAGGAGRKLTQTGRLTLADARALVKLLHTGDQIDPMIGTRVFRTTSSQELTRLNLVLEWAKAARLVRVVKGRLVPVAKNAAVLESSGKLLPALLEAFPRTGVAVAPQAGWFQSPLSADFPAVAQMLLGELSAADGPVAVSLLNKAAWERITRVFVLDVDAERLARTRSVNDRDVQRILDALEWAGAVTRDDQTVALTSPAAAALGLAAGAPEPGDPVLELVVTLRDSSDPVVWRRILVPARYPLPRVHTAIQAAMGWTDSHLHQVTVAQTRYSDHSWEDPEDGSRDERSVVLGDLVRVGSRFEYEYDFGDGWDHDVVVEREFPAEASTRYPACVAGEGACPPEDCGGIWGYRERLIPALADPEHDEHEDFRLWLGLEPGIDFDPRAFDVAEADRRMRQSQARMRSSGR